MARARRIASRLRLALCGALHMDKICQSASPCGLASWNFVTMARAQRIDLRLRLALCGALHMDKIYQSASLCELASWNFVTKKLPSL